MPAWCLPKDLSEKFLTALREGALTPERLMEMTSAERRTAFEPYVGAENAREVNAQFEQKMLLQDKKAGLVTWAKKISGITEAARRDIVATINRMDKILSPAEEEDFLADLAAKKLGTTVTADEGKQIFDLAQRAENLRQQIIERGAGDYAAGWEPDKDLPRREQLGTQYGNAQIDLKNYVMALKPGSQGGFWNRLGNILGLPKNLETGFMHMSAPFVQCWGMQSSARWFQGYKEMIDYFRDEANYQNFQGWMLGHPLYETARQAKLSITHLDQGLNLREESIQSKLAEQANTWFSAKTGLPNVFRASSRGFTGYLNYVRFSRFVDVLKGIEMRDGIAVAPGSQTAADLAEFVNTFTGRGSLGKTFETSTPLLNTLLFAPRKIAGTVNMFNPYFYYKLSPPARVAALKQITGTLAITGGVLAIAKAMGADVNMDPRSQEFAKIQIGKTSFDITGGNAIYLRLLARFATNQEITKSGHLESLADSYDRNRMGLTLNWFRGKLSPVVGAFADWMIGSDAVGHPFSVTQELKQHLYPIVVNSYLEFWMNDPDNTAAIFPSIATLFGVEMHSPQPPRSYNGYDAWGQPYKDNLILPNGTPRSWLDDPVNKEAQAVGFTPHPPQNKIRGIDLNEQQYAEYVRIGGTLAHMRIEQLIKMPNWDRLPATARLNAMKSAQRVAHEAAASSIMAGAQGSDNDIAAQARAARMVNAGVIQPGTTLPQGETVH